jgi:hypothetical protein
VANNTANAPSGTAQGAGIYNKNVTATLNFSSVTGNTASGSTPGPPASDGGGIFNNGGTVSLNFSLVSGNHPNNCSPAIGACH